MEKVKNKIIYYNGELIGFYREDGKKALQHCPKCRLENYAPNVLSGICSWCGFNINNN